MIILRERITCQELYIELPLIRLNPHHIFDLPEITAGLVDAVREEGLLADML